MEINKEKQLLFCETQHVNSYSAKISSKGCSKSFNEQLGIRVHILQTTALQKITT